MGEFVTITASDGHQLGAYRADPTGSPKGGVVIIQEIFGVTSHIRSVVDGYAEHGYVAIAPALFDRVEPGVELAYEPESMQKGFGIMQQLDLDNVMVDARAAAEAISDAGSLALIGYCFGGSIAARSSLEMGDVLSAAVGYYGGMIEADPARPPQAPLMLHFGAEDHAIPLETVDAIKAAWPAVPVFVYDGAGHAFNRQGGASYHEASATLALERTLGFLDEHLS